jgi:hypothetical protein
LSEYSPTFEEIDWIMKIGFGGMFHVWSPVASLARKTSDPRPAML